jgi:hypothetical protein
LIRPRYSVIGGDRHGDVLTVLYGRRVMLPRLSLARGISVALGAEQSVANRFEEYVIRFVPRLGFDALVLAGMDDAAVDQIPDELIGPDGQDRTAD